MFSSEIEVSYFAAGIAAHLASDENIDWSKVVIDKNQIIKELVRPRLIIKFSWTYVIVFFSGGGSIILAN